MIFTLSVSVIFSVKTFAWQAAEASAASSEFVVTLLSSFIIARLIDFLPKGDQSFRSLSNWAALPPSGRVSPLSFSSICFSLWPLAILEAHS